jgi:putative hemolysin
MQTKLSSLGLMLVVGALVLSGCGPTPAEPTEVPEGPGKPAGARDAAAADAREQYGGQAPEADLTWQEERITPEGLVGSETFRYTSGDWAITVSYPVVAPGNEIYHVVIVNESTGFQWEGDVDAAMQVTEATGGAGLANPASVYCEEQGYTLEIRTDEQGSQYGFCVFPDGSECEEWAFFRGECTYEE